MIIEVKDFDTAHDEPDEDSLWMYMHDPEIFNEILDRLNEDPYSDETKLVKLNDLMA